MIVVAAGGAFFFANTAQSQVGAPKAYVGLQPTTPGTSQSGHANVSGTIRASQLVGGGAGITGVNADLLDGINSTSFLQAVPSPLLLVSSTGPATIRAEQTSPSTPAILGVATSSGGTGISGITVGSGTSYAGRFEANTPNGRGVFATATSTTGAVYGVQAEISSTANPSAAIIGTSLGTTGSTYGVLGMSHSSTGAAVFGSAESLSGSANGGFFASNAVNGKGVVGSGFHPTGLNYGGYFESESTNGYGAYGNGRQAGLFGKSLSRYGVLGNGPINGGYFTTDSDTGGGLRAHLPSATSGGLAVEATFISPTARGVQGDSDATTGTPYAIFGDTDGAGWALYASGNSGASGTKSFRIDHPLDPENKYLLHYSSESPTPQNFYIGNVVTGAQGYVWVQLPDYFAEINEDFKYQLTVIDDSDDFVLVKVTREIVGNRFQIRTSKPNVKVSWRVDANRNDAYVRKYPPAQEVDKPAAERGFFEHPEIFGLGKERSLSHDRPGAKSRHPRQGK